MATDYATLAEYKAETNLVDTSGADTPVVNRLLSAASRLIDRFCNRPEGFVASGIDSFRYYSGNGKAWMRIDECVSITTVSVKDAPSDTSYTAWTTPTTNWAGDGDWMAFRGFPRNPDFNPIQRNKPYTCLMIDPNGDYASFTSGEYTTKRGFKPDRMHSRGVPTVRVLADWGFSAMIPPDIRTACIMQTARWYKRLRSQMADAMAGPDFGMLMFRQRLDPDIALILKEGRYVRPSVG